MTGSMKIGPTRNSALVPLGCVSLILFLAFGVSGVQCARYCAACRTSFAKCNRTTGVCNSNCHRTKPCRGQDDLCLATWSWRKSRAVMFTSCFRLPPFSNSSQFGQDCKANILNGTRTCLCQGSHCNRYTREPVQKNSWKVHSLERSKQFQLRRSNSSEDSVDRAGVANHTKAYHASANKDATTCLWITIPAILMLFLIVGLLRRVKCKSDKLHLTESHAIDILEDLEKNVSPDITLEKMVAQGRYGTVWRGRLLDREVAVKIFTETGVSSWQTERSIYCTLSMGHSNILKMITLEEERVNSKRRLVTDFCENGSLREYLKNIILSWSGALILASGMASGLAFLHSNEPHSSCVKVPVAHRDLKSSNILVREDGTCVIADFGLSVSLNATMDQSSNIQIGTYRYMSPEELLAAVSLESMETFKQMDVYSMALVLWEIISRCVLTDPCKEYQLPYEDKIGTYATLDNMIEVVAVKEERPQIPWKQEGNKDLELVCQTLQECWDPDPEARLTADCAQMRLNDLLSRAHDRV